MKIKNGQIWKFTNENFNVLVFILILDVKKKRVLCLYDSHRMRQGKITINEWTLFGSEAFRYWSLVK